MKTSSTDHTPSSPPLPGTGPLLVGLAYDSRSDHALARAVELAGRLGRRLELLHVIDDSGLLIPGGDALAHSVEASLRERMVRLVPPEVTWELRVLHGPPARTLVLWARELDAAAVLLGSHARRSLLDVGRTARALLTHAPCPVWVQPEATRAIRRILVPVDGSDDAAGAAAWARALGEELGASRTFLHCYEPPRVSYPATSLGWVDTTAVQTRVETEGREICRRLQATVDPDARVECVHEDPRTAITGHGADHDLIVMGTHGRGFISAAVLGSVAHAVLDHGGCPTVAIRHARQFAELDAPQELSPDAAHIAHES